MTNDITRVIMANLSVRKSGSSPSGNSGSKLSEADNRLLLDVIRGGMPVKPSGGKPDKNDILGITLDELANLN